MCDHIFSEPTKIKIMNKFKNPFCYVGSSDFRLYLTNEIDGYSRRCLKCGYEQVTTKEKWIKVPNFD